MAAELCVNCMNLELSSWLVINRSSSCDRNVISICISASSRLSALHGALSSWLVCPALRVNAIFGTGTSNPAPLRFCCSLRVARANRPTVSHCSRFSCPALLLSARQINLLALFGSFFNSSNWRCLRLHAAVSFARMMSKNPFSLIQAASLLAASAS